MPPVRGHAACQGCRARKQKCDEVKPTCSRCQALRRECVWPQAQKRGPAKGYVDAVEERLEATENVLLHTLRRCDLKTLDNLHDDGYQGASRISQLGGLPGGGASDTRSRKALLTEWWEQHPLDTGDNVRKWAEALWGLGTSPDKTSSPTGHASLLDHGLGSRQTPQPLDNLSPQRQAAAEGPWPAPQSLMDGAESTRGTRSTGVQNECTPGASNTSQPMGSQPMFGLSSGFCRTHVW